MPMLPTDTLCADTALVHQLQQNPDYDNTGQLESSTSWLNAFFNWLGQTLWVDVDWRVWAVVFGIIVAGFLLWLLLRRHVWLFRRRATDFGDEEAERDIHAIDFERELGEAERAGNWGRVVRLTYLQTLKQLSDTGRISWQPHKTPAQYLYEVTAPEFRLLTNLFSRVRYGNFEATAQLADEARQWQRQVLKGGEA